MKKMMKKKSKKLVRRGDDKWRYGTMRLDIKPDGMRGA